MKLSILAYLALSVLVSGCALFSGRNNPDISEPAGGSEQPLIAPEIVLAESGVCRDQFERILRGDRGSECVTVKLVSIEKPGFVESNSDQADKSLWFSEVEILVPSRHIPPRQAHGVTMPPPLPSPLTEERVENDADNPSPPPSSPQSTEIFDLTLDRRIRGSDSSERERYTYQYVADNGAADADRTQALEDCERKAFFGSTDMSSTSACPNADTPSILDAAIANNNSILLFVHGMGVGPETASVVLAQIVSDTALLRALERNSETGGFTSTWQSTCKLGECFDLGQPVVFSWPTDGIVLSADAFEEYGNFYRREKKRIYENKIGAKFTEFLVDLINSVARKPTSNGQIRINIVAHSMGNRVLVAEWEHVATALQKLGDAAPQVNIIHGAAELTLEEYGDADKRLRSHLEDTNDPEILRRAIYASNDDLLMALAKYGDGEFISIVDGVSNLARVGQIKKAAKSIRMFAKASTRDQTANNTKTLATAVKNSTSSVGGDVMMGAVALICAPEAAVREIDNRSLRREIQKFKKYRETFCLGADLSDVVFAINEKTNSPIDELIGLIPSLYPRCRIGDLTEYHCVDEVIDQSLLNDELNYKVDDDTFKDIEIIDTSGRAMFDYKLLFSAEQTNSLETAFKKSANAFMNGASAAFNSVIDHDSVLRKPLTLTDVGCFLDGVDSSERPLTPFRHQGQNRAFHKLSVTNEVNRCNPADRVIFGVTSRDIVWPYARPLLPSSASDSDQEILEKQVFAKIRRSLTAIDGLIENGNPVACNLHWIAVTGSSSFEGPRGRNEARSAARTDLAADELKTIIEELKSEYENCTPSLFKINLGQARCNRGDCDSSNPVISEVERRVRIYTRAKEDGESPMSDSEARNDLLKLFDQYADEMQINGFNIQNACSSVESLEGEDWVRRQLTAGICKIRT